MNLIKEYVKKGILLSPQAYARLKKERKEDGLRKTRDLVLDLLEPKIKIIKKSPELKKVHVSDIIKTYNKRFFFLREQIIKKMDEQNLVSINKISSGKNSVVGMVSNIFNDKITLEDPTGEIEVVVNSEEKLVLDEVVGIIGRLNKGEIVAEKIIFPDIPLDRNIGRAKENTLCFFVNEISAASIKKFQKVSYLFLGKGSEMHVPGMHVISVGRKSMEGNPYRIKPPTMLDVEGVRVMIVDGKKINPAQITDYLRRRHLLPTECLPGDPYLLDTIPDIIFFFDGGKFYLENNRGITAISPDNKKGVLVDLKTRDARGVAL